MLVFRWYLIVWSQTAVSFYFSSYLLEILTWIFIHSSYSACNAAFPLLQRPERLLNAAATVPSVR
jgi:hypothetical protein